jgi:hypothetical protein
LRIEDLGNNRLKKIDTSFKVKRTLDTNESHINNYNKTIEKSELTDSFETKIIYAQQNSVKSKKKTSSIEQPKIHIKKEIPKTPSKATITKSSDKIPTNDKTNTRELTVLKKQVEKLTKENNKLKDQLQKEKTQNTKFKELTEELIKFYEYIYLILELLQKEKNNDYF